MKTVMFRRAAQGFALPTIVITSVVLFAVLVAVMSTVSSVRATLNTQLNEALARDAAESGVAYADYCYGQRTATSTDWPNASTGPGATLDSGDDCTGNPVTAWNCGTASENPKCYVAKFGNTRVTFSVPRPTSSGVAYKFQAKGLVSNTRASTGAASGLSWDATLSYSGFTQISGYATGNDTSCAIQLGRLYCWGRNDHGQVGVGNTSSVTTPTVIQGPLAGKYVYDVGTGITHTCAVAGPTPAPNTSSRLYCWGNNEVYQYGIGNNTTSSTVPMPAATVSGYYPISTSGRDHNCAIMVSNTNTAIRKEYCWGYNHQKQSGETGSASASPTVATTPTVVDNRTGEDVGSGATVVVKPAPNAPIRIAASPYSDLSNVKMINSVNGNTSCGIDGTKVFCIGDNSGGMMGDGNTSGDNIRVTYAIGMTNATTVVTNYGKVCAINAKRLYCWGNNGGAGTNFRLDSGPNFPSASNIGTPKQPITAGAHNGQDIDDVGITDYSGCFIKAGGVYCWGYNDKGQLGQGNTLGPDGLASVASGTATSASKVRSANNAVKVNGALVGKTAIKIAGGNNHHCALTSDGGVYCWGANNYGQLGVGNTNNSMLPLQSKLPPPTLY